MVLIRGFPGTNATAMSIQLIYRAFDYKDWLYKEKPHDLLLQKLDFNNNINRILQNPSMYLESIFAQEKSMQLLDIGSRWDAMHFVMTGRRFEGAKVNSPQNQGISFAFSGGESVFLEAISLEVHIISDHQVIALVDTLALLEEDQLFDKADVSEMNRVRVYPSFGGGWTQDELDAVKTAYRNLRNFMQRRAANGEGVILYYS